MTAANKITAQAVAATVLVIGLTAVAPALVMGVGIGLLAGWLVVPRRMRM